MKTLRGALGARPLIAFVILAYVLSWLSVPFAGGGLLPHGPFIAAIIVLALTEGRSGLAQLFGRMAPGRASWRWYLIAPGLVLAYLLTALAINLLLGATVTETEHLRSPAVIGMRFLELLLLGGLWEEPGWTGYALPWLQRRFEARPYGQLKASLIMGAIRAGWHLPLVIWGHIPWFDLVFFSVAMQLLISWLFNRTRGSVLVAMVLHLASNVFGGGTIVPLFAGRDYTRFYVLFVALAWLLALLLIHPNRWSVGRQDTAE